MKEIITIRENLQDLPLGEIWYYGPKKISCTYVDIMEHKGFIFKIHKYDQNRNGSDYIKIFDSDGKEVFKDIVICRQYNWRMSKILFYTADEHPRSSKSFRFEEVIEYNIEELYNKLALMAEKKRILSKCPSNQYVYAYILFLFMNHYENIHASQLSEKFNALRIARTALYTYLTDNANSYNHPTDTIYFKILNRILLKRIAEIRNCTITFD